MYSVLLLSELEECVFWPCLVSNRSRKYKKQTGEANCKPRVYQEVADNNLKEEPQTYILMLPQVTNVKSDINKPVTPYTYDNHMK